MTTEITFVAGENFVSCAIRILQHCCCQPLSKVVPRVVHRAIFSQMPIYETNFTWTQDNTKIYLTIPIAGCEKKRLDVFSTDTYLKVNFPPKIAEIFFKHEIDSQKSVAKVSSAEINFILEKKVIQLWDCLQRIEIAKLSKSDSVVERKQEINRSHLLCDKEKFLKELRKKAAVNQQIEVEREHKNKLESVKQLAEKEALQELFQQKPVQYVQNTPKSKTTPIRETCVINVQFTERDLTRPARESQKWQKDAEKITIMSSKSKDANEIEELKHQAENLYNGGDYLAAIEIYSKIAEKDPTSISTFSNRSSCHLRLNNYKQAIDDINKALQLMEGNCNPDLKCKMKCHVKRGTAYCGLNLFAEGLRDYEEALKMNKNDEKLKMDVCKLRKIVK